MKRLLPIIACLLLLACSTPERQSAFKKWSDYRPGASNPNEWYEVGSGGNFVELISPSTIRRRGDIVEYQKKTVADENGEEVDRSTIETNCKNSTTRVVSAVEYWDWTPSDDGIRLNRKNPSPEALDFSEGPFLPIAPESVAEGRMQIVCSFRQ